MSTSSTSGSTKERLSALVQKAPMLFACAALLAALAHGGILPTGFARAGGLILLLGAAWPLLLRWSPTEPSPLKLALLASLLSPLVLGALVFLARWLLGRFGDGPAQYDAIWAWALGGAALLQLTALGKRCRFEPLGKAAWSALALTAVLGAIATWMLWGAGSGLRLLPSNAHWHSAVIAGLERSGALENPWLAGQRMGTNPCYDLLGYVFGRGLGLAPPDALAAMQVWAIVGLAPSLYLIGAVLWREPKRAALTPFLALLAWNALGGLEQVHPFFSVSVDGEVDDHLRAAARAYTLGPAALPSAAVVALAFSLGAWMCASHAVRNAARPWVGLCGILHGAALCLHPGIGLMAALATTLTALVRPGRAEARPLVLLSVFLWAMPGLWLHQRYGLHTEVQGDLRPGDTRWEMARPLLLLLPLALLLFSGRWCMAGGQDDERGRRAVLRLLAYGSILPLLLIPGHAGLSIGGMEVARLACCALGVLAAGGVIDGLSGGPVLRHGTTLLCTAVVVGAGISAWGDVYARGGHARDKVPLAIDDGGIHLVAQGAAAKDLARAYRWIRDELPYRDKDPVLIREVTRDQDHLNRSYIPHIAVLCTELSLWVDRGNRYARDDERWQPRFDRIHRVYHNRTEGSPELEWDPRFLRELQKLQRSAVILVEDSDRSRTRDAIEKRLGLVGARLLHSAGTVAIFEWHPDLEIER